MIAITTSNSISVNALRRIRQPPSWLSWPRVGRNPVAVLR